MENLRNWGEKTIIISAFWGLNESIRRALGRRKRRGMGSSSLSAFVSKYSEAQDLEEEARTLHGG